MLFYIIVMLALIALVVGSITDIKKREVADWVNYGLIAAGFGINLLYSIIKWDFSFIINSVLGFSLFWIFALVMFYSGQWGGGDSKMLMGLGAIFGINYEFFKMIYFNIMNLFVDKYSIIFVEIPFAMNLVINILMVGAVYGLIWSFVMVFMNFNKFIKEAKKILSIKKVRKMQKYFIVIALVLIVVSYFGLGFPYRIIIPLLILLLLLLFYLWIFIKATENSCMLKYVEPMKLTEGDWIARDIIINKKRVIAKKSLTEKYINLISTHYKKFERILLVKRKFLKLFEFRIKVRIKSIRFDDILLEPLKELKISKNKVVGHLLLSKIDTYLRKNTLFNVKVKRRYFFLKFIQYMTPKKLRIGDVLLEDIKIGNYLAGPQDLGIEKNQIEVLKTLYKQKKINKILIKEGIPFVPSFLIAFVLTLWVGNLVLLLV